MPTQIARWSTPFFIGNNSAFSPAQVSAVGGADPGEFVIIRSVFTDNLALGDPSVGAIYGQMYNEDGSEQGAEFLVNTTTDSEQLEAVVVSRNSQEGFAVAFRDFSRLGTGFGTDGRLRLFDGDGVGAGSDVVVNAGGPTETSLQNQISIGRGEAEGAIFVTWTDSAGSPDGDGADIRGRLFGDSGALGPDFRITTTATMPGETGFQAQSNVGSVPSTGFVVTWADDVGAGGANFGGTVIRGQLYSFLGVPIGAQFDVATGGAANALKSFPVSAGWGISAPGAPDPQFVTAWVQDDDPTAATDFNVYARVFSVSGSTALGGPAFLISQTTVGNQSQIAIAAYENDRFIAVWTEQGGQNGAEVRARMFDSSGVALTDEFIATPEDTLSDNFTGQLASVAVLFDTINAHPIPRFVITWRQDNGDTFGQIFAPAASELLGTDWFGSDRPETYTAQYDESVLSGNGGDDILTGKGTDDTISGDAGNDTLNGAAGADTLNGGVGDDVMRGGAGRDSYFIDSALDVVDESVPGSNGVDIVRSTISISLNANPNILGSVENVALLGAGVIDAVGNALNNVMAGNNAANGLSGLSGNDSLRGNGGDDTLDGGDGNDTLNGGAGADEMIGGAGNDVYVVDDAGDVTIEVEDQGVDRVESSLAHTLRVNVENLTLTGAIAINGNGNALGNIIVGNSQNNVINGRDGNDVLTGGGGADSFAFTTTLNGTTNSDRITDFGDGADRFRLDDAVFAGIGPTGILAHAAFRVFGVDPYTAETRVIYNPGNGALLFDADGSGAGAAIRFAAVTPGLALANTDFIIV